MGDSAKKILVIPPYGIGDVLMTTPAIRNIGERLDAEIIYLHMFRTTCEILQNNPFIKANVLFPFLEKGRVDILRFLLGFRGRHDFSINFYPSNRRDYNLAAFLAGSPVRIGHRYVLRDLLEMNFLNNKTIHEDDNLHCVEENLKLLGFLGIREATRYPMEIYLTEDEKRSAESWIRDHKADGKTLIGIHPGTSVFKNHGKRRWPESSFAALIDKLAGNLDDPVFFIFGGSEEKPLQDVLVSMVNSKAKLILPGAIPIRQAAALMKRCNLFISNDSGPMHMAAASGVPTVAIFGPTNPVWVRPWGVRHRVVRRELPCSPCFRYSPRPLECVANRGYECINDISVAEVFLVCCDLINKAS